MPLDAVCLSAVLQELRPLIEGGRIDKIYQPGRDEILLAVRGRTGNVRLLLTANPAHPRIQLVRANRDNPAQPPKLCMLLRKHLTGARILSAAQPPMERVVLLRMEALNELGDRVERTLVLEAMGRRANLILLDEEKRIVECLRRVDAEMSPDRPVLPGLFYRLPPAQEGKVNPLETDEAALCAALQQTPAETRIADWLLDTFSGLSPLICRELAFRAGGETDARLFQLGAAGPARLAAQLNAFFEEIRAGHFTPWVLIRDGAPKDFSFCRIEQYGSAVTCSRKESFSVLLEEFYAEKEAGDRARQMSQGLLKSMTALRDRTARRVNNQRLELAKAADRELLRQQGDILTTNLYRMEKGMRALTAENYYDPDGAPITIPLDPLLTPQQNAAKYYKAYTKARTAERVLSEQIEKGEAELDYLESVLQAVRMMEGERDLIGIRAELTAGGYLPKKKEDRRKQKSTPGADRPRQFRSSAGLTILVGRNNLQNDQLTCRTGHRTDLWFHAQKYHGSHVLLLTEGEEPDAVSVTEAACLAAFYSQARGGRNVPVDYTLIRNVKKPNGAKPGMVIYDRYSTAYVTPDPGLAERLRVRK